MSEEVRTITVKGIELREDQGDGTRIEGIAVPFGQRIGLWRGAAEEFAPDCDFGDTTRTKLSRDHGRLIGKITNATREADGLHITARIAEVPAPAWSSRQSAKVATPSATSPERTSTR